MDFDDMGDLSAHFALAAINMEIALQAGMKKAALLVENTAKKELGSYQRSNNGPFAPWAELKPSTKEQRVKLGFTENDPGLRTGEMRDSIEHQVEGLEALIGSNDDHLVYFELGTSKQAPRSVLGVAMFRNKEKIRRIIGEAAVVGMVGGSRINPQLGYDMDIK